MRTIRTIAIDGPAGSGKSTIGQVLAQRLGFLYFDTGVMYRAVALAALRRSISPRDEPAVAALASTVQIEVLPPTVADGRQYTVLLDGEDVTWALRQPDVDANVSVVSAYASVRQAMVAQQRRIAQRGNVVMVGRDIGTVVMPDADVKIYLDASVEVRAQRRYKELKQRNVEVSYEEVLASMRARDELDRTRTVTPLRPADDAFIVDNTNMDVEDTLDCILSHIEHVNQTHLAARRP
ncbi:MAG: (d)CMP kinase [Anaerolineae bacterium]|nr:(d)CMP kinase [Thermoflexales bacterium]MCX7938793.1 (d)CMP kinase [Thermoflexales bacterium]MDW8053470.1 (d)CMP kinase [Anaerolineae bacterium]MDW8293212.1 (d)CMP kinase [Anaerolineae bacterium]